MTKRIIRPGYRVRFGRVGGHAPGTVPDLVTGANDADELATKVWRYVKRRLVSNTVEVSINLDTGRGTITVGQDRPAGEFTVSRFTPEEVPDAPRAA